MEVDTNVEVLYDFEYTTKDGQQVTIKEGEKLLLLKKTNEDWWQVIRCTGRPFYVPSSYVRILEGKDVVLCLRDGASPASPPTNFTVSVNIKSPPPLTSRTKVMVNCDDLSDDSLSERYGRIPPVVDIKKKGDSIAEANILDDNMSSSLAELAKEIEFRPKHADRLKYAGSFKTRFERKMPLRQFSGSTPDLTCDIEPEPSVNNHTKSVEDLVDLENNVHAVVHHPVVPTPRSLGNNIRCLQEKLGRMPNFVKSVEDNNLKDSSDSVGSGGGGGGGSGGGRTSAETLGASSTESLDRTRVPPVAKPRRIRPTWTDTTYRLLQDEAIYANCLEIAQEVRRRSPGRRSSEKDESASDGDIGGIAGAPQATPPPGSSTPPSLLPSGWSTHVDTETHLPTYINHRTGDKWHSASDNSGRIYFFKENSSESSWTLPCQTPSPQPPNNLDSSPPPNPQQVAEEMSAIFNKISHVEVSDRRLRTTKAYSLIMPNTKDEPDLNFGVKSWPKPNRQDGQLTLKCEGPLHYTKIAEGNKRVRKNWSSAYVVLTEFFLLIYKDIKAFHTPSDDKKHDVDVVQRTQPELTIDLNGAVVSSGEKVSGRKHVLVVSTQCGLQVALQCENIHSVLFWATTIQHTVADIPKLKPPELVNTKLGSIGEAPTEEQAGSKKGGPNIGRSKSVNFKNKDDSMEDLGGSPAERQVKIKARLRKFFHKRPTMDSLVKKGIWKDEPVFGTLLDQACASGGGCKDKEIGKVPLFVVKCINLIESSEENMKTDGLYRASGNLSQIQKIRLQIDQNNYFGLEKEEDIHVLTGALKLFFRELKEPLIPYKLFSKAINAGTKTNKKERLSMFQDLVKSLPTANRDTLKFLLQHLLRVTKYKDFNRMQVANLAIVFGPTLMWPEQEAQNMAVGLMQQNMVIEALLLDCQQIFK